MTSKFTYKENGIEVVKIRKMGGTGISRGFTKTPTQTYANKTYTNETKSTPPPSSSKYDDNGDSDDSDDEKWDMTLEEKSDEVNLRTVFYKSLKSNKFTKCRKFYEICLKHTKLRNKLFGPQESDYAISLSNFYEYRNGRLDNINAPQFMLCYLTHYNICKKYPDSPITYIYVSEDEMEFLRITNNFELLEFIEKYHIQQTVPDAYVKYYGKWLENGLENGYTGDNTVILKEFGTKPTSKYITELGEKDMSRYRSINNTSQYKRSSTYNMYTDDSNSPTSILFDKHRMEMEKRFGKGNVA